MRHRRSYPNGLNVPTGNTLGAATFLGAGRGNGNASEPESAIISNGISRFSGRFRAIRCCQVNYTGGQGRICISGV